MTNAQATQTAADGGYRPRPYIGRHVAPLLPASPAPLSIPERIASLIQSAGLARENARIARQRNDEAGASAAFARAHEYLELARELRVML